MKTRTGDFIWLCVLLLWILILVIPQSREVFEHFTSTYRYGSSFVKFAILSTMGELLGLRIIRNQWVKPPAIGVRFIIWGFLGMAVALVFSVYNGGVIYAQSVGALPGAEVAFLTAFFTSTIMNLTFGPMLFVSHKFTDLFLDLKFGSKIKNVNIDLILKNYDWETMVKFTWFKCCLFFWIPAHTIVFLLPPNYRIIASAFLSIALGLIGAYSKKKKLAS